MAYLPTHLHPRRHCRKVEWDAQDSQTSGFVPEKGDVQQVLAVF